MNCDLLPIDSVISFMKKTGAESMNLKVPKHQPLDLCEPIYKNIILCDAHQLSEQHADIESHL